MRRIVLSFISIAAFATESAPVPPSEHLDLAAAEAIALRQSPVVNIARLKALAAQQVVRQVRSVFFPQITAEFSGVATGDDIADYMGWNRITNKDTRIGATGGLNNPTVLTREANGILFSQLVTDFGRSWDLTAASKNIALSEAQRSLVARAKVLLLVDQCYFRMLQAQAVLRVADETVMARQLLADQVAALAQSKLKSDLDASFARVSLDEAKLLQLEAHNRVDAASADLALALGYKGPRRFSLAPVPQFAAPTGTLAQFISQALVQRPEAIAAHHEVEAASRLAQAERAAHFPRITIQGAAGRTTTGDPRVLGDYAAAGINVEMPLFTGFRLSARAEEMSLQSQAAEQSLRDVEDIIAKDVQVALLNTTNSLDKIQVTASLLQNAEHAYDLAEAKYKSGVTSIVELSQAQVAKLQAQLNHTTTRYEYQMNRLALDFQVASPSRFVIPPTTP